MTPEQAMAEVAVLIYNQHVKDTRYHASLGGAPRCGRCERLGEAAATLQAAATASVGLAGAEKLQEHELEPMDGFYRCSCGEEFQIDSEGVEEAFDHGKEVRT